MIALQYNNNTEANPEVYVKIRTIDYGGAPNLLANDLKDWPETAYF